MKYSFSGYSSSIHSSLGFEHEEQVVVVDLSRVYTGTARPHLSWCLQYLSGDSVITSLSLDQFRFLIFFTVFRFNFRNVNTFISFTFHVFKIFSYFLDDTLKINWNKIHMYMVVDLGLVSLPRHHWSLYSGVPVFSLTHASPSICPVSWLLSRS